MTHTIKYSWVHSDTNDWVMKQIGETRQIFYVDFKIIYLNMYINLKEVKHNSLPLKCGIHIMTSKYYSIDKGKKCYL